MEGYRKTFPEAQGQCEMNGFTIGPDKDGKSYTLAHLDGVGNRLGVKTWGGVHGPANIPAGPG